MKNKIEANLEKIGKASAQLLVLGLFTLTACTKTIPFQEAPPSEKEHLVSKALVDTKNEYLMTVSLQNASRTSSDALPFSSGDSKRVKIVLDETSLRVVETESDARYASNTANDKPVLEVPIEHSQFQCAKDKYGECTNTEENAKDIPWQDRNSITVKLVDAKTTELNFLPIIGDVDCYTEVSSRLKSSEITADAINFDLERTFVTKLECLTELDKVSDATINAVYHYSIVKLGSVLTPGFKTISYPEGSLDERTFGFFSTKRTVLDVDNNTTTKTAIQVMNHWDPKRTELSYYLSDEFGKPENKWIKDLTYQTVANLNQGLAESGVNFRINLHDPAGKNPGDIRNSMIVLVEDPVASNVIGYGPQTEDPVTGEIISARTIMFLGTIKKFAKYTYDDIIRAKKEAKANANPAKALSAQLKLADGLAKKVQTLKASGKTAGVSDLVANIAAAKAGKSGVAKGTNPVVVAGAGSRAIQIKNAIKNLTLQRNDDFVGTDPQSRLKAKIKYLQEAKNCAMSPNIDAYSGGISQKLMDKFPDDAKPWMELSDKEKEEVLAIIIPETWIPTLIHELGHNLGLRHNFQGSEDKANYYSSEELASKNIDHAVPFSSVMDYGDDLRTLPVLGKYDIAALRFGYLRTAVVETTDAASGQVVDSKTIDLSNSDATLEQTMNDIKKAAAGNAKVSVDLKDFKYCTDDNLGISAGCKQFDLGSTYTEITLNTIKDYEQGYAKRNFRNGRESMSLFDDIKYTSRMNGLFKDLRLNMEALESIVARFPQLKDPNDPAWTEVSWLADLKQASLISGAFLAKVILTPDVICAAAKSDDLTTVVAVAPLKEIKEDAMSCFDLKLGGGLVVVGQAGKMFNSMKDPDSTNPYADQIDIRGVWGDKIAAAKVLLSRQIGIFSLDKNTDNYLDVPELRDGVVAAVKAVMTNNVVDKVPFTLADGSVANLELGYDLYDSQNIDKAIHPYISRVLGLNGGSKTQLQQILSYSFAQGMHDAGGEHGQDSPLELSMIVSRQAPQNDVGFHAKSVVVDGVRYIANSGSNTLASEMIDNLAVTTALDAIDPAKIQEFITAKAAGPNAKMPLTKVDPAATPDQVAAQVAAEKAAWKVSAADMQSYIDGTIKTSAFYSRMLSILPTLSM